MAKAVISGFEFDEEEKKYTSLKINGEKRDIDFLLSKVTIPDDNLESKTDTELVLNFDFESEFAGELKHQAWSGALKDNAGYMSSYNVQLFDQTVQDANETLEMMGKMDLAAKVKALKSADFSQRVIYTVLPEQKKLDLEAKAAELKRDSRRKFIKGGLVVGAGTVVAAYFGLPKLFPDLFKSDPGGTQAQVIASYKDGVAVMLPDSTVSYFTTEGTVTGTGTARLYVANRTQFLELGDRSYGLRRELKPAVSDSGYTAYDGRSFKFDNKGAWENMDKKGSVTGRVQEDNGTFYLLLEDENINDKRVVLGHDDTNALYLKTAAAMNQEVTVMGERGKTVPYTNDRQVNHKLFEMRLQNVMFK